MSAVQRRMLLVSGTLFVMVLLMWLWRPWVRAEPAIVWRWVRDFLHLGWLASVIAFLYVRWEDRRREAKRARARERRGRMGTEGEGHG